MSAADKLRTAAALVREGEAPIPEPVASALAAWLDDSAAHADALATYAAEMGDDADAYAPKPALAMADAVLWLTADHHTEEDTGNHLVISRSELGPVRPSLVDVVHHQVSEHPDGGDCVNCRSLPVPYPPFLPPAASNGGES